MHERKLYEFITKFNMNKSMEEKRRRTEKQEGGGGGGGGE